MAKLGQGIVRQGMAEGIAILTTPPTGLQNWGMVERGKVRLRAFLI